MIRCEYKKNGLWVEHIWFGDAQNVEKSKKHKIIFIHAINENNKEGIKRKQNSLISRLDEEKDDLFQKIRKNDRYEIRRALKEGIECRSFSSEIIKRYPDVLNEFESTYNQLFQDKHMSVRFNRKQIDAYIREEAMYFTIAYYENKPYVFHSYIYDKESKRVRLYYSCSAFRSEKQMANMIARMNKLLHWNDLCEFKKDGFFSYDWGGITSFENPNGIDKFKLGFGGTPISYWNVITSNSLFFKLGLKFAEKIGIFG